MLDQGTQAGDAELIRRAGAGDREAFDALVVAHQGAVYRFLRATAGERAEDALQETFLSAWRGAGAFRGQASVRTWLFTIARHAAQRLHRRRVSEPETYVPLSELGVAAGWGDANPERLALQKESDAVVAHALERLSDTDREILLLRDIEGTSGEDVAVILGLTLAAMKTRLHRARLRLAAEVRKTYG